MRRVIIIDDNDDNSTVSVQTFNMINKGSEMKFNKATIDFRCTERASHKASFCLEITGMPDKDNIVYTTYNPAEDLSGHSVQSLLDELTRRGCMTKETVYRRS